MNKKLFNDLKASIKEAKAISRGEAKPSRRFVVGTPDIKTIRREVDMSLRDFASAMGVTAPTMQKWENCEARPKGPARVLLNMVYLAPKTFLKAQTCAFA